MSCGIIKGHVKRDSKGKTEQDGFPLAIDARILLVPTALGAPASALMNNLEIRENIGAA